MVHYITAHGYGQYGAGLPIAKPDAREKLKVFAMPLFV